MFVNEKIVYLHLQKTAGTHIAGIFDKYLTGELSHGRHGQLVQDPGGRLVVGSIRNPWDWYVSMWAYGCEGHGIVGGRLIMPFPQTAYFLVRENLRKPQKWLLTAKTISLQARKDHRYWQRLQSSVDDPRLFREWLRNILSDQGKLLLNEEYPHLPMRFFAGYMTFEFLRLFTDYKHWPRAWRQIDNAADLCRTYDKYKIAKRFIRVESLESDVTRILRDLGVAINERDLKGPKTNVSARLAGINYYDDETIDLVRKQEWFIIKHFAYEAPSNS